MVENRFSFNRGTLWKQIKERSERAKKLKALHAIQTTSEFVQQNNIQFLVRIVSNLAEKEQRKLEIGFRNARAVNPFLPYDEDLWVTDISQTHICLLNKFNVIDHHILLVTRAFEDQESLLTVEDFEAMWLCMAEFDGLAFYNSGPIAGASQQHKHLQIVPLPLALRGSKIPIEAALTSASYHKGVGISSNLPFVHGISPVKPEWLEDQKRGGEETMHSYYSMLDAVGLLKGEAKKPLGAYNLLITRDWMFLIPRSKECFDSISINALGFAGALLVKNIEEMQKVKQVGPLSILQNVGVPQ
jgi:ATP adenylyltransferase